MTRIYINKLKLAMEPLRRRLLKKKKSYAEWQVWEFQGCLLVFSVKSLPHGSRMVCCSTIIRTSPEHSSSDVGRD